MGNEKGVLVGFWGTDEAEAIPTIEWASVPRAGELVRFNGRKFRVASVEWAVVQQPWMKEPRIEADVTVEPADSEGE